MRLKDIIAELLKKQFGIDKEDFYKLELEFEERGKHRIYAYKKCDINVEFYHYGVYFGTLEKDGLRLSIEGSDIIGRIAKKGVIEIDDERAIRWLKGEDIEANVKGYAIVKWGNYFLGCGKGNGKILRNYVPKERRLKE